MVVVNNIDIKLIQKKVFSEIFSFNQQINVKLTEDKTRIIIQPIEGLTAEFAEEGASAIAKLVASKIEGKIDGYLYRNGRSLELTQRHVRFEVTPLNYNFALSIIRTDVVAVMTENKA